MKTKPTLSVVLPTYNCAKLMERHLASMFGWLELADEVIVVDSRSTDGTIELIRERLRHPRLRIIERDRGLYESWNEGIAATTGEWVYISTAGDTIERDHLLHLMEIGEYGQADVVISPPFFVDEGGAPCKDPSWPPRKIVEASGLKTPFGLKPGVGFLLAFMHFPSAILGSSASNIYRGAHLRERPFPTGFKGAGDSVWILRHAAQSRICFTPRVGSVFCVHAKEDKQGVEIPAWLIAKLMAEKGQSLTRSSLDGEPAMILEEQHRLTDEIQMIQRKRRRLWRSRPITAKRLLAWASLSVQYVMKRRLKKSYLRQIHEQAWSPSCFVPLIPENGR